MNKRINELAIDARLRPALLLRGWGTIDALTDSEQEELEQIEKFAEMIVNECIGVVEGGSFLHDQAPTAIFAKECSAAIKRHFSVKK
jgi:DNA-directed RNA polymerase alpha subunit